MKKPLLLWSLASALLLSVSSSPVWGSDHADPMSLNVLAVQDMPEANITDLHAFVVDKEGVPILKPERLQEGDQLIISLCMRRALQPQQIEGLQLDGYQFRVHLDLQPPVRFFDEAKTGTGEDYQEELKKRDGAVTARAEALAEQKKNGDAGSTAKATAGWTAAIADRAALIAAHDADRSAQALYGGIVTQPDSIVDRALLEFELGLVKDGEDSQSTITKYRIEGIPGAVNIVSEEKKVNGTVRIPRHDSQAGAINITTGVFDDPFIFPRFYRRNVVGVVTSIPLSLIPEPARHGPIFLWATTHRGKIIDHVGRSLRSQLPRFGYLNVLPPSEHVKAITRVHVSPTVMENLLGTFLAPLEAHRHYDSAPDVMIYDLRKPAVFPNGRWLEDDVSKTLADAGETLLYELSYAESRQFPRATENDKPFSTKYPYLAPRWTKEEVAMYSQPGVLRDGKVVPRAPDTAAIAAPNLNLTTWHTLWAAEVIALSILLLVLLFSVRSNVVRWVLVLLFILAICALHYVYAPNLPATDPGAMTQPNRKLWCLIGGAVTIVVAFGAWLVTLGRRSCEKWPLREVVYPQGQQEFGGDDLEGPASYVRLRDTLFDPRINRQYYHVWGKAGEAPLPIYHQTFPTLISGLIRRLLNFAMFRAAHRTLLSRADLRPGPDGRGFRRLVHPMGVCLEGKWEISATTPFPELTGYFAPGKSGRVIARYSLGGNNPRNGNFRSLGLVGKLFPMEDPLQGPGPRANFITQEDLGGTRTYSIAEVLLTNSPSVTLQNRRAGIFTFLVVILALVRADKQIAERQLYEIAELEKPEGAVTNTPRFLRLTLDGGSLPVGGSEADFRDEILGRMYDRGDETPQRPLVFNIEVSLQGDRDIFKPFNQDFKKIGKLTFTRAACSWNGDFLVHFHHPVWRNDVNDARTIARPELRPVPTTESARS